MHVPAFVPRLLALAAGVFAALHAAAPARADSYFGAAGGAFVPFEGDIGWTVLLELGTDWSSEHVRVGGEAVFSSLEKTLDTTAFGGSRFDLAIRTYELRFVTRYVMFPGRLSPYVGVGGGFVAIDTDAIPATAVGSLAPFALAVGEIAIGGGLDGQLGLELPLFSKELNLFAEARAKYNWELTGNLAPFVRPDETNGFSGVAGLRGRF